MRSVTPYDTAHGRRCRVRYRQPNNAQSDKRGFTTKREAELFLASIELTNSRGEYVSAAQSRLTIEQTAQEWISSQVQLKPSTRAGHAAMVRTQVDPKRGLVSLGDLSHAAGQTWISDESKRVSPATVRSYHRVLSMILKYAIRDGRITRNVAERVGLPRINRDRRQYLSHALAHKLASPCGSDGDIVLVLACTALRWGEMAALRVGDLELPRRCVNVNRAVAEGGRDLFLRHSQEPQPPKCAAPGVPRTLIV